MPAHDEPGAALYRQALLDHGRRPRNRGRLPCPPARLGEARNRVCGDALTLYLELAGDRVARARFEGQGCAISQAAASLLTEALQGRARTEIAPLSELIRALVTGEASANGPVIRVDELGALQELGELAVLSALAPHPARHPCALLVIDALDAAMEA